MIRIEVDIKNVRETAQRLADLRVVGHDDFKLIFPVGYLFYIHLFAWPRRILITSAHNAECIKYGRMIPARWPHSKSLFLLMEELTKGEVI